jgi:hypothetical protein
MNSESQLVIAAFVAPFNAPKRISSESGYERAAVYENIAIGLRVIVVVPAGRKVECSSLNPVNG